MALAGEIVVNVIAKTKGYSRGLDRARGETTKFKSSITSSMGSLAKWSGALAGVTGVIVGVRRAVQSMRESFERLDSIAKTADRLGLTGTQLATLQKAAKLSGANVETLNMGLQRMTRRIAEAAQGTGEAKNAIAELGLSAQSLVNMGPYEAFLRIADAMGDVTTQADKVRLAAKLFDSEGVKLVNTLGTGSDKLREMQRETMKLGGALQKDMLSAVEKSNDAWTDFHENWAMFKDSVWAKLAPLIEGAGKLLGWLAKQLADTGNEVKEVARVNGQVLPNAMEKSAKAMAAQTREAIRNAQAMSKASRAARERAAEAAKLRKEAEQTTHTSRAIERQQFAGAAMRGTTAAYSAEIEARATRQRELAIEKAQLEEQQEINEGIAQINDNLARMNRGGVALRKVSLAPGGVG